MKIKRLFLVLGVLAMVFVLYNTFIKDEPQTDALTSIKVEDLKKRFNTIICLKMNYHKM
ncbi:UNVERIFIED_ORG: uncharacterized membrane protein YobD (UPF0266 family) [Bacillus proteolyticus]|nr:hypothetical protein [Bacillus cereus]